MDCSEGFTIFHAAVAEKEGLSELARCDFPFTFPSWIAIAVISIPLIVIVIRGFFRPDG